MSAELLQNLGLTNIHSQYEFYSDGKFLKLNKPEKSIN